MAPSKLHSTPDFKQTNCRKIIFSVHRTSYYPNITLLTLDDVFSACFCLRWCGFFPPPGVLGTVIPPSDAVETSVNLCLTNEPHKTKSLTPHTALSASVYWRRVSMRTGTCCGRQSTACFRTWFMLSQLLFVQQLTVARRYVLSH